MIKLDILFDLLRERKAEYEAFAEKVGNKELKRTVLTLAQEVTQYANELCSQIETMGGEMAKKNRVQHVSQGTTTINDEADILKSCEVSESKMISAYRAILNEPSLHENLRSLMRYQLNGLTYAYLQIKLLNASFTSFHR